MQTHANAAVASMLHVFAYRSICSEHNKTQSHGKRSCPNPSDMPIVHVAAYTATTAEEDVPVTYNYSFFHLVFALASMYIAMLMTGWGANPQERDLIDVGWTSVWVKLVTQWVTAATYVWMLIAPAIFPDRDFSL